MRLHFFGRWLCLCFSFLGVSCAVTRPSVINAKYADVFEQRHNHYKLKVGDSLSIRLYDLESDLNQADSLILSDGRSDLFQIPDYVLAGKTIDEVKEELKRGMAAEFRTRLPDVKIQVIPAPEFVYLVGEFQNPSQVPYTEKMTLQEAISVVGGLRVIADTDWALLRRPYLDPLAPDLFRIDLNDASEALYLLPGDQIVLGTTWLATIMVYLREYLFGVFGAVGGAFQAAALAGVAL